MDRILIIKPSSLGDIIHTLPLAHALKRCLPGCHLGWVVQEAFTELLDRDPAIDAVYPINISSTSDPQAGSGTYLRAFKETIISLKRLYGAVHRSYDTVLDLHASFRSGLIGLTATGAQRTGFKNARELNTLFQHRVVTVPETVKHALEKNLLFANNLGISPDQEDFQIYCNQCDRNRVGAFLQNEGIDSHQQIIYANPAARWQTKFWPREHWAKLADLLQQEKKVLVFGGSDQDSAFIRSITALMKTTPVVAAGQLSLPQSVALLKMSNLYIGLDSGPMHMAAMAAVPVVALFGPTHPDRVGPYNVDHRIVRAEGLDCLECRQRSCDHLSCMKGISVEMVYESALSLLKN